LAASSLQNYNVLAADFATCWIQHPDACTPQGLLGLLCSVPQHSVVYVMPAYVLPGFAIVKLATDRKTQEQYAVKIMTLPPTGVQPGDNESTR